MVNELNDYLLVFQMDESMVTLRVAAVRKSQEWSGYGSLKSGKMVNVQKVRNSQEN